MQVLKFQLGYELVWDGNKYVYAVDDAAARIITRCAIQDDGGIIRVKVAKGASPVQLSSAEETSFNAYMQQIKFAGSNLLVVNFPSDKLRFQIDIYYNAQVELPVIRANCEAAILGYLANFEFNGRVIAANLTDALQRVEGVVIPVINFLDRSTVDAPAWQPVGVEYQTSAGYAEVSPSFGFNDVYVNGQPTLKFIPYE
jgi:hypothetical protein